MGSRLKYSGKVLTLGISGGSGSGKTTIVSEVRKRFKTEEVCILSLDDYYLPRAEQLTDENGFTNFDLPRSINESELLRDINLLKKGLAVDRLEYTFNNDAVEPKMLHFVPAPVLIVEGIFIYHYEQVREALDIKIFIEADHDIKLNRRIKRDSVERNYPESDVRYRFKHHVTPSYDQFVAPYKSICDIVINNNISYKNGLAMVLAYLENKLKEV